MNFEKYTIKSQEIIQKAAELAQASGNQAIEPGHMLTGILVSDENVVSFLLKKLSIQKRQIEQLLEEIVKSYPQVSGQQPYLSNDSKFIFQKADKFSKEFKDEIIAIEHLLL